MYKSALKVKSTVFEKKYKYIEPNKKSREIVKNCFEKEELLDFWVKKVVKCKTKMNEINPTPRSITHRKPIKISRFFNKLKIPDSNKYTPALKSRAAIPLEVVYINTFINRVISMKSWSK